VTEVERGNHRQKGRHTVAELLDRWMVHIEGQGRAASTLTRYRSAINANIKPRIGHLAAAKVGPADLDGFYSELVKAGLGPLSVRKSHAILSAAFNQALKWDWVDRNPVYRTSPPSVRAPEIHPPTPQHRQLLTACVDEHPVSPA
jgi:integrase